MSRNTAGGDGTSTTPSGAGRPHAAAPRLDALTGLRIFAAAFVYLSHVPPPNNAPQWLTTFLGSGYMGVTLFFVLSGFVLSLNYFDELRRPTAAKIWAYAVARFARVYPLYLLVLVYVIVRSRTAGEGSEHWLTHVFALQAWNPSVEVAYALNPPAWSVSVEVFLYAMFPLVCLVLARVHATRTLLILAGLVVAIMVGLAWWFAVGSQAGLPIEDGGSAHRWLYRSPLSRLGDFVLGVLAARIYLATRARDWNATRRGTAATLGAVVVIIAAMGVEPLYRTLWSFDVLYAVPATVLILGLAVAPRGILARLLSRPRIVLFGEASYAFYLIHVVLLGMLGAGEWSRHLTAMTIAFEVFTFGLVLAAAVGLHVLVEKPVRSKLRHSMLRRELARDARR